MSRVLVDSSVWIAHFKASNESMNELLGADKVLSHPFVRGELACGTPPSRETFLVDLADFETPRLAVMDEVLAFVEREKLFGLGCGFIDLTLLVCTMITPGVTLWTLDRRLAALSDRFTVSHRPLPH